MSLQPAAKKRKLNESTLVLFEDNDIIAFDKPFNMLSVPGREFKPIHRPRGQEWEDAIKRSSESYNNSLASLSSEAKEILHKLAALGGIPRKKEKFLRFIQRSLKCEDKQVLEEIWVAVVKVDEEMHRTSFEDIPDHLVSAADMVERHCGHKIYHVHRLDMETSGVLLFAKNDVICAEMSRQFRDSTIHPQLHRCILKPGLVSLIFS
jgi:hypothetical protein